MIGKRLKEIRKLRGYTQEQIAEKLSVSLSAVKKWEQDKTDPNTQLFIELADYLDVSLDYLLNRDNKINDIPTLENDLLTAFRQLDDEGKKEVINYIKFRISSIQKDASETAL